MGNYIFETVLFMVAAIGALFYAFIWPMVQRTIVNQTCKTYGPEYKATTTNGTDCIAADAGATSVNTSGTGSYPAGGCGGFF